MLEEKYVTAAQAGQSEEKDTIIPFNPIVAKHIEPPQSFTWKTLYEILMTDPLTGEINGDVHDALVDKLNMTPSNVFEDLFCRLITELAQENQATDEEEISPGRCYVPGLATTFQEDISSWCTVSALSNSQWLLGLSDLISFYYMMYLMQLSRNLSEEWNQFVSGANASTWSSSVHDIPFGIRTEPAGRDRDFRTVWSGGSQGQSLYDDVYYSWMRLAVTRILNDSFSHSEVEFQPRSAPVTLLEAHDLLRQSASGEEKAVDLLLEQVTDDWISDLTSSISSDDDYEQENEENTEESNDDSDSKEQEDAEDQADVSNDGDDEFRVVEAAKVLYTAVDAYYRDKKQKRTTAVRLGPAAVEKLGKSHERAFIEERSNVGHILTLDEGALTMMARIFTKREQRGNGDYSLSNFQRFLNDRGIDVRNQSEGAMEEMLEAIGLIQQESDSGESTNVRTY